MVMRVSIRGRLSHPARIWTVLAVFVPGIAAWGEQRMIDVEPYDQMVLKGQDRLFKLKPIEMARRVPLRDQPPDAHLVVRLFDRPRQQYQVDWRLIDRVELFEELVLREAAGLVAARRFDAAHRVFWIRADPVSRLSGPGGRPAGVPAARSDLSSRGAPW